jgi:Zn-dependent peptidase ImmA (M78 family)/DNA-binding XRE family transcriptional regulator
MNDKARGDACLPPSDHLDDPLVRYVGDTVLALAGGRSVDLNALTHPFTGEIPQPVESAAASPDTEQRETEALEVVGHHLRVMRENHAVSRAELAKRTGLPAKGLVGLEKGDIASLSVVSRVVAALGGRLRDVVDPDILARSNRELSKVAIDAGAPHDLLRRILQFVGPDEFSTALSRGFSWAYRDLMHGTPRAAPLDVVPVFKALSAPPPTDSPVLALARRLSKVAVGILGGSVPDYPGIPAGSDEVRGQIRESADDVTLDALLAWTWAKGIVVVPLSAGSDFVAAVWLVDDRPVIVLNDSRAIAAFWLFDLAHELGHLACGHVADQGIIEVGAPFDSDPGDAQERQANDWALSLLLAKPEELLADVRRRTAGDAPHKFKFAVRDVAREAGIAAGPLGLIASRAMADVPRDQDRWGSASNLAKGEDPDGRVRVREAFLSRVDLEAAEPLDLTLLRAAALA